MGLPRQIIGVSPFVVCGIQQQRCIPHIVSLSGVILALRNLVSTLGSTLRSASSYRLYALARARSAATASSCVQKLLGALRLVVVHIVQLWRIALAVRLLPVRVVVEVGSRVLLVDGVVVSSAQKYSAVRVLSALRSVVGLLLLAGLVLEWLLELAWWQHLHDVLMTHVRRVLATPVLAQQTSRMRCARRALRRLKTLGPCPLIHGQALPLTWCPPKLVSVWPLAAHLANTDALHAMQPVLAVARDCAVAEQSAANERRWLVGRVMTRVVSIRTTLSTPVARALSTLERTVSQAEAAQARRLRSRQ